MNNKLIDTVHEEIDRLASMADIASIEFNIFCSKVKFDAKVRAVKPLHVPDPFLCEEILYTQTNTITTNGITV